MKAVESQIVASGGCAIDIAVAFLLSEAAGFMTGAELIIDGGMTRKMIYAE